MKKIYSKFVKDRIKKFQIETALWDVDGVKCVSKKALYAEGQEHINNILETYDTYFDSGLVCGAKQLNDMVLFEYIDGRTFESQLFSAMKKGNKVEVQRLVERYNKIVDDVCAVGQQDADVYSNVIFDLTFDNLIFDGQDYKVIDYEWRYVAGIEKEYITFRAAYAFLMKFKGVLVKLYSIEEFYDFFGVSSKNIGRYVEDNNRFIVYVYGQENYNQIIKKYEKMSIELFEDQAMGTLKTLQKRKNAQGKSHEGLFFDKLLSSVEKNKEYYDDYTKFYKVTQKIRDMNPNGYTETPEFLEEFSAYIDDMYGLVEFYKNNFQLSQQQNELLQENKEFIQQQYNLIQNEKEWLQQQNASLEQQRMFLSEEIARMQNTKVWRARNKILRILGK